MTVTENGTALAVRDIVDLAPRMVVSLTELRDNIAQLEQFKRDIMVPDVDYGKIPNTPKPTLLKPGAEKLALAFGMAPSFEHANRIEDWERGFFHYEERCILSSRRSDQVVATANGSANSREARYRWRTSGGQCTACSHDLKRRRDGGAWCPRDSGGCGKNYTAAEAPKSQRVENPEPWDLANTVLKMAQKRALVAAVLIATGGSGIWTQDVEDLPAAVGDVIDVPYVPMREQDPAEDAPTQEMITSADDRIWKRWLAVKAEAEGLGIRVSEQHLPIAKAELAERGQRVFEAIETRKQRLAEADAERAWGKAAHEDRAAEASPAQAAPQGRAEDASPSSARRPSSTNPVQEQAKPQNIRQAAAERQLKPTDTPCSVEGCGRMVDTQALLKEAMAKFGQPYCVAHINELLDGLKDEKAVTEEAAF